ncbi:MAG: hypothetical protein KMY55_14880 [Dethiosulfatibacter sp.]|nr:hypothetical protein [Dethiosulfatibacter sp.]
MDHLSLIKGQNKMVVKLLWISAFLSFLNNMASVRDIKAAVVIIVFIGGVAMVMSYMVYTNKMIHEVKYLAIAGTYLTVLVFIAFTPGMLSYLTIYIALFILGIYQDQKVIAISAVLSLILSTFAFVFYKEMIFHVRYHNLLSLLAFNFFILLSCCLLVLQGQFSAKVYRELEKTPSNKKIK